MNDPHRVTPTAQPRPSASPFASSSRLDSPRGGVALRVSLWSGSIVCAAINMIGNSVGGAVRDVGMVAGIVSVGSVLALIAHHYVRRRP
ncbi:hypothetical protein [Streptosporangium saharense]|uniref:hypothetical protein n=1 Tax=Streptosporangium saharense TaxID=1706840 RepID=UPI003321C4E6